MKVPMRYRPETRPSSTPLQPFNVQPVQMARGDGGIGRALSSLADGIQSFSGSLAEQQDANSRLEGLGALARFRVEQEQWVETANRNMMDFSEIDKLHQIQFIEKAESLIAALPESQREWATEQLIGIYLRNQTRAQNIEWTRNQEFVKQNVSNLADTIANEARSNPERARELMQQFREQASNALIGPSRGSGNFPATLIRTESGGNWQAYNNEVGAGGHRGHGGRLQFGTARLAEAAKAGIIPQMTAAEFAKQPEDVQAAVENWHFQDIDNYIKNQNLDRFVGTEVKGIEATIDGMRAVAHLGGKEGLRRFLESNGRYNPSDVYGTSLSDYFAEHAGFTTGGVLGVTETQDVLSAGERTIINAGIQGMIENNPEDALAQLEAGEFDDIISPSQKNTLTNQAQAAILQNQRKAAQVRATEVKVVLDQLAMHENEMWKNDVSPQWDNLRREAAELGGEEGQMIAERIDFLEGVDSAHRQFVNFPPIERARVLQELDIERHSGRMVTQNQIDFHELLKQSHKRIQQQAEKDGYSLARRHRIVEPSGATLLETLRSDPAGLALRDQQAAAIKRSYGPDASIMTQEEMEQIRNFAAESDGHMISIMNAVVDYPFLRNELKREFANDDAGIAAAFDIAAQGDTDTAQSIIRGRRLLDLGLVSSVPPNIQLEASVSVFGDTFTGIEEAEAAYLRAAHLYYVGNLSRSNWREQQLIDGRMPANPSTPQLIEALQAVLPGQIEAHNGRSFITPNRDIGSQEMNQIFRDLRENENWWRDHAVWYDAGGNLVQLDSPPTYPDGTSITIDTILDQGQLATLEEGGLYRVFVNGGYVGREQFNLALDLSAWADWGREEFRNRRLKRLEKQLQQKFGDEIIDWQRELQLEGKQKNSEPRIPESPGPLRSRSPGDPLARERRVQSIPGARLDSSGARQ